MAIIIIIEQGNKIKMLNKYNVWFWSWFPSSLKAFYFTTWAPLSFVGYSFLSVLSYHLLPFSPHKRQFTQSHQRWAWTTLSPTLNIQLYPTIDGNLLMTHWRRFCRVKRHLPFPNKYKFLVDRPQIFPEWLSSAWFWCDNMIIIHWEGKNPAT